MVRMDLLKVFLQLAFIFYLVACEECTFKEFCESEVSFFLEASKVNGSWSLQFGGEHKLSPNWNIKYEDNNGGRCNFDNDCRATVTITSLCNDYNKKYKLHMEQLTWREAKDACEKENSHLVILNSNNEYNIIKQMIIESGDENFYAGIYATVSSRNWVDLFGNPVIDFWAAGQPDNLEGIEYCGTLNAVGLYHDYPCDRKYKFICETLN